MNDIERRNWLATLKVGDEVTYRTNWRGDNITTIKRITPTGQIKTEDGRTFRNGYCKINSWEGVFLRPLTQEVRERIFLRKTCLRLVNTDWEKVSPEKLKRIVAILGEE